jgi:hypothetical protein
MSWSLIGTAFFLLGLIVAMLLEQRRSAAKRAPMQTQVTERLQAVDESVLRSAQLVNRRYQRRYGRSPTFIKMLNGQRDV